jgi:membrane protease YdiL (CAAX protease family)
MNRSGRDRPINKTILVGLGAVWLVLVVAWAGWLLRPARSAVLPPQRRRAVPWGGMEVLLAFLISQFLWPTVVNDALRVTGFFRWVYGPEFGNTLVFGVMDPNDAIRVNLWRSDFAMPLSVASMTALLWALSSTRPYQVGLTAHRLGKNVLLGVLTGVCVVPVVYLILLAVNASLRGVGEAPEEHPITKLVRSHPRSIDFVAGGFAALVAAPLVEELLFRGIIQPWFRTRRWGEWFGIAGALFLAVALRWSGLRAGWRAHGWAGAWPELLPAAFVLVMAAGYLMARARLPAAAGAVFVTSLLFAAGHSFALSHPVPLFVFSLALGALRFRTQSLVPSVVAHGLFNAVAWVLLLLPQPAEKGKETTDARARPGVVSTSSVVPGSALPRRTYASATTAPSAGDQADDVTCPASLPSRVSGAPAGGGSFPSTRSPVSTRLTWPRSRRRTIGSWPR